MGGLTPIGAIGLGSSFLEYSNYIPTQARVTFADVNERKHRRRTEWAIKYPGLTNLIVLRVGVIIIRTQRCL